MTGSGSPIPNAEMTPARRVFAALFGGGLLLVVLSPMLQQPRVDGFPLSTYPMFSSHRDHAETEIFHVVGFSREGRHRPVSPEMVGSEEIMQAYQTVKVAIRRGHAAQLCADTAARVRTEDDYADIERLEVRTDLYDALAYFGGNTKPRSARVHARCAVAGASEG